MLFDRLALPLMCAPMSFASSPQLAAACCGAAELVARLAREFQMLAPQNRWRERLAGLQAGWGLGHVSGHGVSVRCR